jgi:hypothetical protein
MPPSNSDRIAICGEPYPDALKQYLLFFDRIGIFDLKDRVERRPGTFAHARYAMRLERRRSLGNDLEFLQAKKLVFEVESANPTVWLRAGQEGAVVQLREGFTFVLSSKEEMADVYSARMLSSEFAEQAKKNPKSLTYNNLFESRYVFMARLWAHYMRHSEGREASAIWSKQPTFPKKVQDKIQLQSTNVIDVVLDKLPLPSELTPWEAILDFKADKDAQGYLQGLKVWMNDIARQKLSANEASEKLDWLLFQHKKHLEMHKLSYRWGTLGGTFVAAAEIFEDLAKIKWGKAAGAVVSIFDKRLELMKSELANPAKEISYIVKAQEQFGE